MNRYSLIIAGENGRVAQIRQWLREVPAVEFAGQISESKALRLIPHLNPDVVLLDATMLAINVLSVVKWLQSLPERPRIVVVGEGAWIEQSLFQQLGAVYLQLDEPAALIHYFEQLTSRSTVPLGNGPVGEWSVQGAAA